MPLYELEEGREIVEQGRNVHRYVDDAAWPSS